MFIRIACVAIAIAGAVVPLSAANGDITHLDCTLEGVPYKISLDENNKTVTWAREDMVSTIPAVFLPDSVTWGDGVMKISRIDLSFTRTVSFEGKFAQDRGICKIVDRKKRAF